MANSDNEVKMMMSVVPGAMTGFAALNAGMSSILNVFNSFTRSFDAQFGLMDAAITTTAFVVTQLGVDAMHAFGEFEQGMKIVQMVSGQTAQDMDFLKQKANDFSVQYRMDIDQITEGLQTLGRAGLNSASEQTEVLQAGLNTAKLEGRDLNAILQELIQNTSLLGGDLKSSEFGESSQYVNDLLVATSMTAPITTHDVSETLKYSGGIAAAAGANIETEQGKAILEDYMGAIAAFAQKGVTGSIAGTALRAFLNKPATQDSSVTEALASINLKPEYLWEDGEETMKPISEQIGLIQSQMDKLDVSKMDRLQIWSKIVGGKMGQQMMKLDSESIKDVTKDIQAADSASNLAAGSMKTFEANVKQASEQGQVLERNIGANLVFFANPILEVINKIAEFLGQDGMALPLTAGVLAAVGILAKRIIQVFNVAKTELGSLLSMGKEALAIHVGKHGYAKWEEEAIRQQQAQEKTTTSSSGTITATTLKNFDKQYSSLSTANNALSVSAMKAADVSDQNIAIAGRLSSLTKQISIGGTTVSEGTLWGMAIKQGALTDSELSKLQAGHAAGLSGRALADSLGKGHINTVVPRLEVLSQALKELGISAQNVSNAGTKVVWTDEERAAAEKFAETSVQATIDALYGEGFVQETIAEQTEIAKNAIVNKIITEEEEIAAEKAAAQAMAAQAQAAAQAQSHATALGSEVKITSEKIVMDVHIALSQVEQEFINFARHVAGFSAVVNGKTFGPQQGPIIGSSTTQLPPNIHELMGIPFIPHKVLEERANELYNQQRNARLATMADKDTEMRARYAEERYKHPYIPASTGRTSTDAAIEAGLRGNRLKNDFKEYNDAQAEHYKRLADKSSVATTKEQIYEEAKKIRAGYIGTAGVGSIAGRLPSEEAIQASIKANEEAAKKTTEQINQRKVYTSRGSLSEGVSGMGKYGVGLSRSDIKELGNEADSIFRRNFRNRSITRGSMSEETSGMGRLGVGLTRADIDKFRSDANGAIRRIFRMNSLGRGSLSEEPAGLGAIPLRVNKGHVQDYLNKMGVSSPDQVIKKGSVKPVVPSTHLTYEEYFKKEQEIQDKELQKAIKAKSTHSGSIEKAYKDYYMNTIGKDGEIREKQMYAMMNSPGARGSAYTSNTTVPPGWRERLSSRINTIMGSSIFHPIDAIQSSGFYQNLTNRLNRDRTGSFFSFGREERFDAEGKFLGIGSATKGLKGFGNKLLNATDMVGGPFMVAMMAATAAIQLWQKIFQEYCQELQDAQKQLKEAFSERSSAEDQLEQTFREQNPNATPEEIEMMILDTYGQLYDDRKNHPDKWMERVSQYLKDSSKYKEYEYNQEEDDGSYKEKEKEEDTYEEALRKNTSALYSATAEIDIAMSKLTTKMNDIQWGIDGWTGQITDGLGYMQDHLFDWEGTTYTESGGFLLTASQQDENYPGSKEMAGLLIEDFHDAQGNWKKGLETLYGKDSEFLTNVMNLHARTFLSGNDNYGVQGMAHFANRLTPDGRGRIQASMMNDKKTWQSVAKEIFKYESKNKKRVGTQETSNKRMERLIQKLQIDTHLSRMQVIQAAYFQELQDMYQVMEQVFSPLLAEQAQTLAQNLLGTQSIDESSSGTRSSTFGTQSIASVISANVALIARSKAAEAVFNEALAFGPDEKDPNKRHMYELAKNSSDANEFYKKAMDESYGQGFFKSVAQTVNGVATMVPGGAILTTAFGGKVTNAGKSLDDRLNTQIGQNDYTAKQIGIVYRAMAQMMINPNLSFEQARKLSEKVVNNDPRSMGKIMTDIGKMYSNPNILKQIEAAYGASDMGEADGSGGGSGSGSGSGDSDKSEGTKKERVDLVLCNKKEIPKLNVNLFKKPPTFTVLNKNFKLRDVKINTEDKPKAIMASIKNAFIDVQKRSDPKIIQDEEAEYDPVAATDGNSLPSGSSKPKTNN